MEHIFSLFHFRFSFVEETSHTHSRPMAQVELIPRMAKNPTSQHADDCIVVERDITWIVWHDSVVFRTWEGHGFNCPRSTARCWPSASRSHACLPLHLVLNCNILHQADVFISVVVSFMVTLCNRTDHIFSSCHLFFLSFYLFFPAAADWMSAILPHMVWP